MGKLALTAPPPSPCSSCDSSVVPPSILLQGGIWLALAPCSHPLFLPRF